jgi:hypothetical protein
MHTRARARAGGDEREGVRVIGDIVRDSNLPCRGWSEPDAHQPQRLLRPVRGSCRCGPLCACLAHGS